MGRKIRLILGTCGLAWAVLALTPAQATEPDPAAAGEKEPARKEASQKTGETATATAAKPPARGDEPEAPPTEPGESKFNTLEVFYADRSDSLRLALRMLEPGRPDVMTRTLPARVDSGG